MMDEKDLSHMAHRSFIDGQSYPVMPLSGLMSRKLYRDTGGMDKNFIKICGGSRHCYESSCT